METIEKVVIGFAIALVTPMVLLFVWATVSLPLMMETDRRCLAAGYPKSSVTWNWETYCLNLDGSVTVRVDRQQ